MKQAPKSQGRQGRKHEPVKVHNAYQDKNRCQVIALRAQALLAAHGFTCSIDQKKKPGKGWVRIKINADMSPVMIYPRFHVDPCVAYTALQVVSLLSRLKQYSEEHAS